MFDRVLAVTGAFAAGANAAVAGIAPALMSVVSSLLPAGRLRRVLESRPGSILVAIALFVGAGAATIVGLEATRNPTPRSFEPGEAYRTTDFDARTYATLTGWLEGDYVVTYRDTNSNGVQDPGETGREWFYFVTGVDGTGVVVRSDRDPDTTFTATIEGIIEEAPDEIDGTVAEWGERVGDLQIEPRLFILSTGPAGRQAVPLDLAATPPPVGAAVQLRATLTELNFTTCLDGGNGTDACETEGFVFVARDPASQRAILVLADTDPYRRAITMTGMIREDPGNIRTALRADGLDLGARIQVSNRFLLHEGTSPVQSAVAFGVAGVLLLVGLLIVLGVVTGPVVFRRETPPWVGPSGSVPGPVAARASGLLDRVGLGRHAVRQRLVVLGPSAAVGRPTVEDILRARSAAIGVMPAPPSDPAGQDGGPLEAATTDGHLRLPLGRGALEKLEYGRVVTPLAVRPGLRVLAAGRSVVIAFDDDASRDLAYGNLVVGAALRREADGIARA